MLFSSIARSMEQNTPSPSQQCLEENNTTTIPSKFNKLVEREPKTSHKRWTRLLNEVSFYEEHANLVKSMLQNGVNSNYNDEIGNTPLMRACWAGCTKIVELLLEYEADPAIKNSYGESPLTKAVKEGHLEIITLLLQHKNSAVNAQDNISKNTALIFAVKNNLFTTNIYQEDINLRTKVVIALLYANADPYIANKNGRTAISIAIKNDFNDLAELMKDYRPVFQLKKEFDLIDLTP